jgi:hypothetical protein
MGGFDLNKDGNKQRRNGDSWHCLDSHKHGRSKSASSERDLHTSGNGASQSANNFTRMQVRHFKAVFHMIVFFF